MNFSHILPRGKNAALKEEQPCENASSAPAVAWAIAIYFIERERQRAQVEIARLTHSQGKVKEL